ncbi:unnamed protein product, partial [Staurois parvus]
GRQYNNNTVQYKRLGGPDPGSLQSKREGLVVQMVITGEDGLVGEVEDSIIS